MQTFVTLLRAVNVGGTGKLPMAELKRLCEAAGFEAVRTVLASGNAVLRADASEAEVKASLEAALTARFGKPAHVCVRTADAMAAVVRDNPFPTADPRQTVAIFLDAPPPADFMCGVSGRDGEELRAGTREIYVAYGGAMARSKLRIGAARTGTARNMATIAKLAALAGAPVS